VQSILNDSGTAGRKNGGGSIKKVWENLSGVTDLKQTKKCGGNGEEKRGVEKITRRRQTRVNLEKEGQRPVTAKSRAVLIGSMKSPKEKHQKKGGRREEKVGD